MSSLNSLIEYLQVQIHELEHKYNTEDLLYEKNKILENINFFEINIENIDLELISNLFNEFYGIEIASKKYELFQEIMKFKDYFSLSSNEPQIITCLKYINEFKEVFLKKIAEIDEKIREKESELQENLNIITKYENYFTNNQLARILSVLELDELFEYILNSSLDKEIVFNLIVEITNSNIFLYEKKKEEEIQNRLEQIRKNSTRIKHLIDVESTIDTKEDDTEDFVNSLDETNPIEQIEEIEEELSDEENELYQKIQELYQNLKHENVVILNEEELVELIDKKDFTLDKIRKDLYNPNSNLGNMWAIILLDLEVNLLPNFKKHKLEITEIFKRILTLYQENFISKNDFLAKVPALEELDEINKYVGEYENLTDSEKNTLISMKATIDEYGTETIGSFNMDISYDKLQYYLEIAKLKEIYSLYQDQLNEDINNDKTLADMILSEVYELINKIKDCLNKIKELQEIIELSEVAETLENEEEISTVVREKNVNLLLFPTKDKTNLDIHNSLIWNIELLKYNYPEHKSEFLSQNVEIVDKILLKFNSSQIKNVSRKGGKRGKSKNKNGQLENDKVHNFYLFDTYNVFRYKHKISTGGRVSYMYIPITENNKKMLKDYFKMDELSDICFVINFDGSITSDKEYVRRTHIILNNCENYIKDMISLFGNDFTEQGFEEAKTLLEASQKEFDTLKQGYYKKEM